MNWTALYFLSILDNLGNGFTVVYYFCIWTAIAFTVYWGISRLLILTDHRREKDTYLDLVEENYKYIRKWALSFFAVAMVFRLLSSMVPGKRDLVEAYAMIEGSKIITAQNGELVAKEAAKRFDRFVDIIAARWGTPATEPAPEPKATTQEDASVDASAK
jgi:hypothetical protein